MMDYFLQKNRVSSKLITILSLITCLGCTFTAVAASDVAPTGLKIEMSRDGQKEYRLDSSGSIPLMQESDLHPDFVKLLSAYPQALASARQSISYSEVSSLGSVVMAVGALMGLTSTMSDANSLGNNEMPSNNNAQETALVVVAIGAVMSMSGSNMSSVEMNRALEIFNKKYTKNKQAIKYDLKSNRPYFSFSLSDNKCKQNHSMISTCLRYQF